MITVELQLPSTEHRQAASFQEIDAVAALQHLVHSQNAACTHSSSRNGIARLRTVSHLPKSRAQASPRQQSGPQLNLHSHCSGAFSPRVPQHTYTNDGVRLSDLGEQPLAVGSDSACLGQQELSFNLPDHVDSGYSHSKALAEADEQSHPNGRSYICTTKDDPLVKGRLVSR